MKSIIIRFLTVILFVQAGYAQDIIFFRDRTTVNAMITGLSERNISYKKYENQQGVLYSTPISKIDSIKWESGEVTAYLSFKDATKKKGYKVGVEFGIRKELKKTPYLVFDEYVTPVISSFIGIPNMYRFNPYIALGGVIGLDYSYWYEPLYPFLYSGSVSSELYYDLIKLEKIQTFHIPLSIRTKVNFTKSGISPYFLLDCGYSFMIAPHSPHFYRKKNGLNVNASIGFDVSYKKNMTVYVHAGYYLHQNIVYNDFIHAGNSEYSESIHSFSLNIGYKF
jgi:hypothetical protein